MPKMKEIQEVLREMVIEYSIVIRYVALNQNYIYDIGSSYRYLKIQQISYLGNIQRIKKRKHSLRTYNSNKMFDIKKKK